MPAVAAAAAAVVAAAVVIVAAAAAAAATAVAAAVYVAGGVNTDGDGCGDPAGCLSAAESVYGNLLTASGICTVRTHFQLLVEISASTS